MNEGDRTLGGKEAKFPSDLLGYQGYTVLPQLGHMITGTGFVAPWYAPPQTIKSPPTSLASFAAFSLLKHFGK